MRHVKLTDLLPTYRMNGLGLRGGDEAPVFETLDGAVRLEADFSQKLAEIQADPRLTNQGKSEAARELGKATLASLKKWHEPLATRGATAQRDIRATMAEAATPAKPTDIGERIEAALAAAELRRVASSLDDLGVELLYRKGDASVRAALDSAPRVSVGKHGLPVVRPFVPESLRVEMIEAAGAEARPDLADILHNATAIAGLYQIAASSVENAVRESGCGAFEPAIKVS